MRLLGLEISRPKRAPTRFLGDIAKVDLRPGDVCVLMTPGAAARDDIAQLTAVFRATFGEEITLIVLEDGMRMGVLSPPQAVAVHKRLNDEQAVDKVIGG